MKFITAVVVCSILGQALAGPWGWFGSQDEEEQIIDAAEDVNGQCLQYQALGSCQFYDCIERRFPCLAEGYTERISKHFCALIDAAYSDFDENGQFWLNRTSVCLMQQLHQLYHSESTTCGQVQNAGIEAIITCNAASYTMEDEDETELNFCSFIESNGGQYHSLMGHTELRKLASLRDRRVWTSMISQALTCGVTRLADTISGMGDTLVASLGNIANRITNIFS